MRMRLLQSRGVGTYKELSYVLEVKDRDGNVVEKWEDSEGERAIDEQVAYELSSIMSDANARNYTFGSQGRSFGFVVPGVWTASKTGTTTTANSAVTKDSWMASYSTAISTVVWNGNHDGSGLTSNTNQIVRRVVNDYMENVHKNVYAPEGLWAEGDQPTQPEGIQTLTVGGIRDIWPSWYNSGKNEGTTVEKVQFNKENKLRAAECTPENLRVEVEVTRIVDPISGSVIMHVPDGYNYDQYDPCTVKEATIGINAQEADGGDAVSGDYADAGDVWAGELSDCGGRHGGQFGGGDGGDSEQWVGLYVEGDRRSRWWWR